RPNCSPRPPSIPTAPPPTASNTLSLPAALPICFLIPWRSPAAFAARINSILDDEDGRARMSRHARHTAERFQWSRVACDLDRLRSEEHTSELQSHLNLVCRLLLEKTNIPV